MLQPFADCRLEAKTCSAVDALWLRPGNTTHNTPAHEDTFSQLLRHELAFLAESLSVARPGV